MATGYAPDEQSFRRIANVVRTVESAFPSTDAEKRGTPNAGQLYVFRRLSLTGSATVTDSTFTAIQPTEADGWNWQDLYADCGSTPSGESQPTDRDDLEQFSINQAALCEGCILPGQLFHGVNLDNQWYAVGKANTSIEGVYDQSTGTLTLDTCNDIKVPVVGLVGLDDDVDGSRAKADWIRHRRLYVVSAFGCET